MKSKYKFPYSTMSKMLHADFKSFIIKTFYTLHYSTKFSDNWHIDLLSECLKEVYSGHVTRLIINLPPRSLKSICISVACPAWFLGLNPEVKIITASYSQSLSTKHSNDCRDIIFSDWYQHSFPDTKLATGNITKNKFLTTRHGFRFATSIGGTLTGEGADFLIVDDPITPMQALSKNYRQKINTWFEQTFCSRLNDRKKGSIIVVMQRLHCDDLAGYLLAKGGWQHIRIPEVAEVDEQITFGSFKTKRKAGTLLHNTRIDTIDIKCIQLELGSYGFAAQYQQSPFLQDSGIIKLSWIQRYTITPEFNSIYQSWDCAITTSCNADYTVCTTWRVTDYNYYLLHVYKQRLEYPALKKAVIEQYHTHHPLVVLIEDKASGQQLIQELKNDHTLPLIGCKPKYDKMTRLIIVSGLFEAGYVFLPNKASWLMDFEHELLLFPNASHDDQVDATTQFLEWIHNKNKHYNGYSARIL